MSGCSGGQAGSQFCDGCPHEESCHNLYNCYDHKSSEVITEEEPAWEEFEEELKEENKTFYNMLYEGN